MSGCHRTTSCAPGKAPACSCGGASNGVFARFDNMIEHCLEHADAQTAEGKPVVGIMCEFTPRELILAAGATPVCLCGGSQKTAEAAEAVLPAGVCPLIKSTFGYHLEKSNPFIEMASLIVAETTCDAKKKMFELLAKDRPVYVLELPQKPDDPDAMEHWKQELRKLRRELQLRFDTLITDEKLRAAIELMNRERRLRRKLAALMKRERPPLTGRQLLDLKSSISAIPEDLAAYETIFDQLDNAPPAAKTAAPVRVMLTGVPVVQGAERVVDLIEDNGGLVVAMENCTGLKPIYEDVRTDIDPMDALAEKYFHLPCSVMTPNTRRQELLAELARDYAPQCVIELVWQGCLTYDVESAIVKQVVEEQLGLPYLRIVTDYAPADSSRIAVRIEALFETVGARS